MNRKACETKGGRRIGNPTSTGWGLLLAAGLLGACGKSGGDGGTQPTINHKPNVTITANTDLVAFVEGDQVPLDANGVDVDHDVLSYSWSLSGASPGSLDVDTGAAVVWTAGADVGDAEVTVTVNDGDLSNSTTWRVVVGTEMAGSLTQDTVWDAADAPYVVTNDLSVTSGHTLTLEPGVDIYLRPALDPAHPGEYLRRHFSVQGSLVALGTGTGTGQRVGFFGGRDQSSFPGNATQHWGVAFAAGASGQLTNVTIENGDVGVVKNGAGTLRLRSCRIRDCGVGIQAGSGANLDVRDCSISNCKSDGISVNSSILQLRTTTMDSNVGSALKLIAVSGPATADADSCKFFRSGAANIACASAGVGLRVHYSNFLLVDLTNSENIDLSSTSCSLLSLEIRGNYWGLTTSDPQVLLDHFAQRQDCGADVANWQLSNGDWYNSGLSW